MCEKCGCSETGQGGHGQAHAHAHWLTHTHAEAGLAQDDRLAERNRGFFLAKQVFVVNLLSFSQSNAHALVERTQADYGRRLAVISVRFLESVHALHTHHGHAEAALSAGEHAFMDAHVIGHACSHLALEGVEAVLIENGGSAACQAVHDLGESARVAVFSVREGELKPLKCPLLFRNVAAVVINEADLSAATAFDAVKARSNLEQAAPGAKVLEVSPQSGAGVEAWYAFLDEGVRRAKAGNDNR